MAANIGSSEWWTERANSVIDMGLGVLKTKLQGVDPDGSNPPQESALNSTSKYLPYVIGAAVIGGIILILSKR